MLEGHPKDLNNTFNIEYFILQRFQTMSPLTDRNF